MASRHVSKVIARAASVVVEALERRQLFTYNTLELFAPPTSDSQTSTALPNVLVYTPEPAARATVGGGVRLAWPAVIGARNGYEIHRRTGDGAYEMIATVRGNAALGRLGGRVSYLDLDVQPGEAYTYRVRGVGPASTRGEWSENISVLTDRKAAQSGFGRTTAMIAASARLAAYATSGSTAQLAWSKRPISATGYEIQRRFGDYDYATIATLSSEEAVTDINGQIAFEDTQLLEGEGYTYRIRALGVTGNAASWSNEYSVLIPRVSRTTDSFVLPSQGTTVTLNTTEDTHARGGTGATSYFGNDVWNGAKLATGDEHREAFYKFNLSSLSGAVTGVKIRFNGRLNTSDGTKTFLVKAVSSTSWTEAGLNYNNRPGTGATLGSFNVSSTSDGWYEVDVTSYVNAERALNHSTVSFAVVGAATSTAYFRINSKESGGNSAQLSVTLDASTSLRTPTDDTHGRSGTGATSIFGNDVWNGAKLGTGDEHREAFYKFNLSGLEGNLEQAVIRFYGHLNTSDGTRTFNVQSVSNTSWLESSLTYNNRPTTGRTMLGSFNVSSTSDGWYEVDVTDYVASQIGGSQTVASFAVVGNATSNAYFWINSKESGLNSAQLVMTVADAEPPMAPSSLQATQTGAPVVLNWSDNSTDETGFVLERSTSSSFTSPTTFTVGANTQSYSDESVAGNTTYYYRVKAVNGSASSNWSATASITTAGTTTSTMEPSADTYVRGDATGTNYGTATDMWVRNAAPATNSKFAYMKFDIGSLSGTVSSATLRLWTTRSNLNDSSLQFAIAAVSDNSWSETGMTYNNRPAMGSTLATVTMDANTQFRWYEINVTDYVASAVSNSQATVSLGALGVAATSAEWQIKSRETTTGYDPQLTIITVATQTVQPPTAPTDLVRVSPPDNSIRIQWDDESTNETAFEIQRRSVGGSWTTLTGSHSANTPTYDDSSYNSSVDTQYQVRALNGATPSDWSNELTVPAKPASPTSVSASPTAVMLTWADVSGIETGYHIERSADGLNWTRLTGSTPISAVAGVVTYSDSTVSEGDSFYYRARALSSTAEGLPGSGTLVEVPRTPPTAANDTFSLRELGSAISLNILANDTVPNPGSSYISSITTASHGTATIVSGTPNKVSYTPDASYTGVDAFTYTIADGYGNFSTATASITVLASETPEVRPAAVPGALDYTTVDGYTLDASVIYVPEWSGNFSFSKTYSSTSETAYATIDAIQHVRTTTIAPSVVVNSTLASDGNWYYSETFTQVTTVAIAPVVGGTGISQSETITDHYSLIASGDSTESQYAFVSSQGSELSGSYSGALSRSWSSDGSKTASVSNSADLVGFSITSSSAAQVGSDTYTASGSGAYDYSEDGRTVTGSTSYSSEWDDTYSYDGTSGVYAEHFGDDWSYSGSGTYADDPRSETGTLTTEVGGSYSNSSTNSGTLNEGGSGSSSSTYTTLSELVGNTWIQSAASTSENEDSGYITSTGSGTYNASTTLNDGGHSSSSGTNGTTASNVWGSSTTLAQSLGSDGSWTITSGDTDSTGGTNDNWNWGGTGTYTDATQNTTKAITTDDGTTTTTAGWLYNTVTGGGTNSEGGTGSSTSGYSIHSNWAGGSWVQSGTSTTENQDSGHVSSTGTGTYNASTTLNDGGHSSSSGTNGTTASNAWGSSTSMAQSLGSDGNWTVTSGNSDSTGTKIDTWNWGGAGTYTDATQNTTKAITTDDGTTTTTAGWLYNTVTGGGTNSEGGTGSSTSGYSIHSDWSGDSWVQSGTSTSNDADGGHVSSTGTGTYNANTTRNDGGHSSSSGTSGSSANNVWGSSTTMAQSLGSDGSWTVTSGNSNSTGTKIDNWNWGGAGTYTDATKNTTKAITTDDGTTTTTAGWLYNTVTGGGTNSEGGTGSSTSGYSIHSNWAGGSWVQSGTSTSNDADDGHVSSAGTGSYSWSVALNNGGHSSSSGTSGTTASNVWGSSTTMAQSLGSDGSWTVTSGNSDSTGTKIDNWNWGGAGTYTDATQNTTKAITTDDGTTTTTAGWLYNTVTGGGTNSEGGTGSSTSGYSIHSNWAGGSWVQSGTSTSKDSDGGHISSTGTGTYNRSTSLNDGGHSSSSGSKGTTASNVWGSSTTMAQSLGSDGNWTVTSGSSDSTGTTADSSTYVGSGSESVLNSTFTENGSSSYGNTYNVHSDWDAFFEEWSSAGNATATARSEDHSTLTRPGTYSHDGIAGSTFAKSTDDSASSSTLTSNLGLDGKWTITTGVGNSTGSTFDSWSYAGNGSYSSTNLNGSITESGKNETSNTYSVNSTWSNGDWVNTGTSTGTTLDRGGWTSSGTGTYSQSGITGTTGATHSVDWDRKGSVTLTLSGSDWQMSTGVGDSTGSTKDDWSYGGSGPDASATSTTVNQSGTSGTTQTYAIHADWDATNSQWTKSGTLNNIEHSSGHWGTASTVGYTHSVTGGNLVGTTTENHAKDWSSGSTQAQTLGANGTWATSSNSISGTVSMLDEVVSSGVGEYVRAHPYPFLDVTGEANESHGTRTSQSFTSTGVQGTNGTYTYSGNGTATDSTFSQFGFGGEGSLSRTIHESVSEMGTDENGQLIVEWDDFEESSEWNEGGSRSKTLAANSSWTLGQSDGTWRASSTDRVETGHSDEYWNGTYEKSGSWGTGPLTVGLTNRWGTASVMEDWDEASEGDYERSVHVDATGSLTHSGSGEATAEGNATRDWYYNFMPDEPGATPWTEVAQDSYDYSDAWNGQSPSVGTEGANVAEGGSYVDYWGDVSSGTYSNTYSSPGFDPSRGTPPHEGTPLASGQISLGVGLPSLSTASVGNPVQTSPGNAQPGQPAIQREKDEHLQKLKADYEAAHAVARNMGWSEWTFDNEGYNRVKRIEQNAYEALVAEQTTRVNADRVDDRETQQRLIYEAAKKNGTQIDRRIALTTLRTEVRGNDEDRLGRANLVTNVVEGTLRSVPGGNIAIRANDQGFRAVTWGDVGSDVVNAALIFGPGAVGKGIKVIRSVRAGEEVGMVGKAVQTAEACGTKLSCFVGGTPVLLGDGTLVPIETIHVGDRVETDGGVANSADGQTAASDADATQVDPHTWRLVTITAANGDWQIQTLVPVAWIESNHVVSGVPIRLADVVDVAEMGVPDSLYGTVQSVEACPTIEDGPGRVVLTTVSHSNDFVFDLTLTDGRGQEDVLGVTGYHKIYSESREWVSASELEIGEVIRGANGDVIVTALARRPGTFTVYNMTVESDHVYYVGDLTALVHNTRCDPGLAEFVAKLEEQGVKVLQTNVKIVGEGEIVVAEADVVLGTAIIEYKNGAGRAADIVKQVLNTQSHVSRPVLVFGENLSERTLARAGGKIAITNNLDTLISLLR